MDAVIRFCFTSIDPEKITCADEYAKIYGQAKYIFDYQSLLKTKEAMQH